MDYIKVLTATALFDGHDVSINIFRRLLQQRGAEVVHLGHNRSVREVVNVALQEDVDAILISSYQGGHNEYFSFLIDELKRFGAEDKLVFGGGGGVILPSEISYLEKYGVAKLYHALDGQKLGISGIADDIILKIKVQKRNRKLLKPNDLSENYIIKNNISDHLKIAKQISLIEEIQDSDNDIIKIRKLLSDHNKNNSIVLGVTGTGGSGKSSVIDEIIGKFLSFTSDINIAVLAVDPTKTKTGGALLGDRIRYNQINNSRVFFRSFATRNSSNELNLALKDSISLLKTCGFDLIIIETSGIGQGDSNITELSDLSMYVMTAEFGAPTQLEKIDMLDYADFIVINKFEKKGSEDALREVIINYIRNRHVNVPHSIPLFELDLPVYATCSNQFNNHGINKLFKKLLNTLEEKNNKSYSKKNDEINLLKTDLVFDYGLIDNRRINYLSEITEAVRNYHSMVKEQVDTAKKAQALNDSAKLIKEKEVKDILEKRYNEKFKSLSFESIQLLKGWDKLKHQYQNSELKYTIQDKEFSLPLYRKSLSGLSIPKVAMPKYESWADLLRFLYLENLPGFFPYTSGVFPFKRITEDPKRQFAGEGGPERTNKRFHFLTKNDKSKRLSVAFDGVTLYGEDPALEKDIYGKVGESGVSICTLDDMNLLLKDFNLTDPLTSVSMTINAPAPIMVAFYFITAYQRELQIIEQSGKILSDSDKAQLKLETFRRLRGTVQADMLKEDQGQNTCIFSVDFAMKLIGDMQEFLSKNKITNYYSLSISGYHIAEAGANPITQLAFTLANGFTYVEYFLNRGLKIDDFAPNLSFFFSNGMDPEYSVIGRVARRIWAIAMKNKYNANEKSQKLKYHIQTSGRSLHAQEHELNDIRTTLQGLLAFYDNCNSLHTNSNDEAITTPTEESVRRSMAIQMILANEFGMLFNENPNQGSFIIEELTDLVEEAVLVEFNNLSRRGGVLGAMEVQYQRSKIQEQSLYYESLKQSGEYPIIGVNTFIKDHEDSPFDSMKITRASDQEKQDRINELNKFKEKNKSNKQKALDRLKSIALQNGNIFEELLNTVESCSMGEITNLLYEIGGKYRRGM